jgi:hypothetical protein
LLIRALFWAFERRCLWASFFQHTSTPE